LGKGMEIKGTIKFRDEVVIEGKIEGEIISESNLILSSHALVTGEVSAEILTLFGKIRGNATITGRAILKSGSEFYGDLTAQRVEIEEGTTFVGQARIIPDRRSE